MFNTHVRTSHNTCVKGLISIYMDIYIYIVFLFRSYGRLNKKCRYKKLCNSKTLLLLKLYFGQHFTERAQCIITHVIYMDIYPYQYRAEQKRMSSSNNICALLGFLCTAKQRGNLLTQCTHCPHVPS